MPRSVDQLVIAPLCVKPTGLKEKSVVSYLYTTPKHQHEDTTTIIAVRYCTMSRHAP